ncbi:porin [Massilia sp. TS11]|uniref:porin n=1 Tax=Massilia sp. TS11 TaxID=2908003 RepID=UPI001EDBD88B|nr:porin [Massilia sp. TS11]MCG2583679.1 hypothetical protein [Massilia sp. TS11]
MTDRQPPAGLRQRALALAIAATLCAPAFGASKEAQKVADLEKKLEASMKMIEQLNARLAQLEQSKADARSVDSASATLQASLTKASAEASAAAVAAAAADSRATSVETSLVQMQDASARAAATAGVPLHGFMDVGYVQSNRKAADGRKSGFTLGSFDLYLTPELGGRVKSLIELNFEHAEDGSLGTDLERLQFGYTFDNEMTLWLGRFHTPYGYWNTAFHHGAQIQNAISRPRFLNFEDNGGILPAHSVGLWASGQVRSGDGKLAYDAYLANGSSVKDGELRFNSVRDDNSNKLLGATLKYSFGGAAEGLSLGVHGFQQQVPLNGTAQVSRERMLGGFALFDNDDWEVLSEYYHFNNANPGGAAHSSWAGYAQAGRSLDPAVLAFVRWEKASLNGRDALFSALDAGRSYTRSAFGLRYTINPKTVLKFELNRTDDAREGRYNEAAVQAALRF